MTTAIVRNAPNSFYGNCPEDIREQLLDFLVGPIDYHRSRFSWVLKELTARMDNALGRATKAAELEAWLETQREHGLIDYERTDYDYGNRRNRFFLSNMAVCGFTLDWDPRIPSGPTYLTVSKNINRGDWVIATTGYFTPTEQEREQLIRWDHDYGVSYQLEFTTRHSDIDHFARAVVVARGF